MAKITRIKANDAPQQPETAAEGGAIVREHVSVKDEKTEKARRKKAKAREKEIGKTEEAGKKPFILLRPFVALGHYIRDSWRELRQVRWPNRKTTWKMLVAVILYAALFMVMITLLDMLFSWLFNLILNK